MKIISLVPSLTYTLVDLGLLDHITGRTKFCKIPFNRLANIPVMGGTKNPNRSLIIEAKPDLIIANKEENRKEDILFLKKECKAEILITDVFNLKSNQKMLLDLGALTQTRSKAKEINQKISQKFDALKNLARPKKLCTYLIWEKPLMSVGGDTFINSMLDAAGFNNYFRLEKRYPIVDLNQIPDQLILLSSEPFPFNTKHKEAFIQKYPQHQFLCVEGRFFTWYGSYLLHSPEYFLSL